MTSQEQGRLRNEAEALVKASAWLARRAEIMAASTRVPNDEFGDGNLSIIQKDACAAAVELQLIADRVGNIAQMAGMTASEFSTETAI